VTTTAEILESRVPKGRLVIRCVAAEFAVMIVEDAPVQVISAARCTSPVM